MMIQRCSPNSELMRRRWIQRCRRHLRHKMTVSMPRGGPNANLSPSITHHSSSAERRMQPRYLGLRERRSGGERSLQGNPALLDVPGAAILENS